MKFDLFSNLRPAGDTVAAASWVNFTPLNGETDCSTCVTQNYKRKIAKCFSGVFTTLWTNMSIVNSRFIFLRGVKLFDAITFELEWWQLAHRSIPWWLLTWVIEQRLRDSLFRQPAVYCSFVMAGTFLTILPSRSHTNQATTQKLRAVAASSTCCNKQCWPPWTSVPKRMIHHPQKNTNFNRLFLYMQAMNAILFFCENGRISLAIISGSNKGLGGREK